ncbi:tripeptidyl-peptidase 1 precursor [Metarhizium album ARSEF 1941]|uniref:tripeptidyl-peptidase II n=1 Tax=Metarhizium album (strain ARSEF 1941) TaxID=1081103 RepID=A0A0B2WJN8_METAS|nr:tripeptidyl-peptidase 1 precursor [Metarhizium album ARSEF 1941]KHN94163.1 tripeptidyl-peptidase 1 precursor [Metarhizium album ARSEF 1941]
MPASQASIVQKLSNAPQGWTQHDVNVDKTSARMKLRIHLAQPRISEFQDLAMKIATPGNKLYGKHLAKDEADKFLAPTPESVQTVQEWLKDAGLGDAAELDGTGDNILVHASVADVEKLLHAEYSPFVSQRSGEVIMRTLQYSLPDNLKQHIDVVQPTTYFGMTSSRLTQTSLGDATNTQASCGTSNPSCLSQLYSYGSAKAYSNGRMGIAGFIRQFASQSDLATFMKREATQNNTDQSFSCVSVNNGSCQENNPGIEANLDVQYARAITEKIPNVFYSTGGSPPTNGNVSDNEPYLEFLQYLLGLSDEDLPNTISISYGDIEYTVPNDYANKCCDLFSKLGARGVSVLVASGDTGVGSSCPGGKFETAFPAACPWVTTVGGTDGTGPENAWSGSGGGFSELFPQPSYQADAVNGWLRNDQTHQSQTPYFNSSGRAYPDVSALATNFPIVVSGAFVRVGGTSAASPVFASIVQLLNSDRLLSGKKPLGFLNPWLYSRAASALTSITHGSNNGCRNINGQGFQAVEGWNPVTGLGTPNFEKLLEVSQST